LEFNEDQEPRQTLQCWKGKESDRENLPTS
jgi:hypothetical protein